MQTGLLLIALAFGYKIFSESSANAKKSLKQLGRVIGIYIMVVSFIGSLCVLNCVIRYGNWNCPFKGQGWSGMKMCPITGPTAGSQMNLPK